MWRRGLGLVCLISVVFPVWAQAQQPSQWEQMVRLYGLTVLLEINGSALENGESLDLARLQAPLEEVLGLSLLLSDPTDFVSNMSVMQQQLGYVHALVATSSQSAQATRLPISLHNLLSSRMQRCLLRGMLYVTRDQESDNNIAVKQPTTGDLDEENGSLLEEYEDHIAQHELLEARHALRELMQRNLRLQIRHEMRGYPTAPSRSFIALIKSEVELMQALAIFQRQAHTSLYIAPRDAMIKLYLDLAVRYLQGIKTAPYNVTLPAATASLTLPPSPLAIITDPKFTPGSVKRAAEVLLSESYVQLAELQMHAFPNVRLFRTTVPALPY